MFAWGWVELEENGQPQIVLYTDTVRTAGKTMARSRKAVSFRLGFRGQFGNGTRFSHASVCRTSR